MPPADRGLIVVTGAAGFLGREVVRHAAAAGLSVRALVRREPAGGPAAEYRALDLAGGDSGALRKALSGASAVIHAAGRAHLFSGESAPGELRRDNGEAAAAVARAAKECGVSRVVLASSVSVYAPAPDRRERDESARVGPASPYGESKLEAERLAAEASRGAGGPRLVILRLATLYGPGDPGNVARLIRAIDRGRFIAIGDGSARKSLLAVADAARACLAASGVAGSSLPEPPEKASDAYNVTAAPCTMGEVVGLIYRHLGRALPRLRVPSPLALALARAARVAGMSPAAESVEKFLRDDAFSGTRFRAAAGWKPRVSLDDGLGEEVAWYRDTAFAGGKRG